MLWGAATGRRQLVQYCRSFQFNPGCDRPTQLDWRPEGTLVAQMIAMLTLMSARCGFITSSQDMTGPVHLDLLRLADAQAPAPARGLIPSSIRSNGLRWRYTDALIKLREDTELQPPANKPYMGPMFLTDAHTAPPTETN